MRNVNVILRRIYKRGFLLFDPFHARLASNTRKMLIWGAKFFKGKYSRKALQSGILC